MSKRRSQYILLILVIALCGSTNIAFPNSKASGGLNHRRLFFGISDPNLINDTPQAQMSQLSAMRKLGITAIRVDANWDWVQPTGPTSFNWYKLDQEVKSIRANNMSVDLIIDGCPPWAALPSAAHDTFPQPASARQYATWAATVAIRYAALGVSYFEIWNEPNNLRFWQPKPNPAAYTADLVAAYQAIKRVDPAALVISGGLSPAATDGTNYSPIDFLKAMYADGAKGNFDALGLHPYSFPAAPDTYEPWSAWSQMNETTPSIRGIMKAHGDAAKQIWITEFGAPSIGPQGVGQVAQAQEFSQGIAYARKKNWVGGFYIYTWRDIAALPVVDNGFGLLDDKGMRKLAYAAVQAAVCRFPRLDYLRACKRSRLPAPMAEAIISGRR